MTYALEIFVGWLTMLKLTESNFCRSGNLQVRLGRNPCRLEATSKPPGSPPSLHLFLKKYHCPITFGKLFLDQPPVKLHQNGVRWACQQQKRWATWTKSLDSMSTNQVDGYLMESVVLHSRQMLYCYDGTSCVFHSNTANPSTCLLSWHHWSSFDFRHLPPSPEWQTRPAQEQPQQLGGKFQRTASWWRLEKL